MYCLTMLSLLKSVAALSLFLKNFAPVRRNRDTGRNVRAFRVYKV